MCVVVQETGLDVVDEPGLRNWLHSRVRDLHVEWRTACDPNRPFPETVAFPHIVHIWPKRPKRPKRSKRAYRLETAPNGLNGLNRFRAPDSILTIERS